MIPEAENPSSRRLRELADSNPDGLALESPAGDVTWAELDAQGDALAALLVARLGDGPDSVAVRIRGYGALLATATGVARAGKVLVALDPTLPAERAVQVLEESDSVLLLTDLDDVPGDLPVLRPDSWTGATERTGFLQPRPAGVPNSIVFTSGSTGVPKGIAQSVMQVERSAESIGGFGGGYRIAAFDVGSSGNYATMVLAAIVTGSTMVPYDVHALGLASLHLWLREHSITAMGVVPTLLKFWLPSLPEGWVLEGMRTVGCGGEALMWPEAAAFRKHLPDDCVFWNVYGMSETGPLAKFAVHAGATPTQGRVPTGTLNEGVHVSIMNPDGQPVAVGEHGEIVVDFDGIALGYWRRPDLTDATFPMGPDGRRVLWTGDGGFLDAAGDLHHLGRLDDVVKVSAHRVELGDVSAALTALPEVRDAVTVATEEPFSGVRLHSHVILETGATTTPAALRQALTRRLPGYMLPDTVQIRDTFPRLTNDKVDRQALIATQPVPATDEAVPSDLLEGLTALWRTVLEVPVVSADDDFFALGGDSLRAARLFAEIQRHLGHDRPPTMLLDAPTPALLAAALVRSDARDVLVPGRVEGSLPPLFVVHGGLGDLLFMRDLVAVLDPEQPVYGLLAPALDGLMPAESSLEELAARYLAEVRQVWRSGPLHLFGYSLGSHIAFEMAQQALAAGDQVGVLALGDAPSEIVHEAAADTASRAQGRLQQLRTLPRADATRLALELGSNQVKHWAAWLRTRLPDRNWTRALAEAKRGNAVPVEMRGDFVARVYGELAYYYRPRPLDAPVLLLRASAPQPGDPWGWDRLATSVHVVDLPGDHSSMVREDVGALAAALTSALAGVRA